METPVLDITDTLSEGEHTQLSSIIRVIGVGGGGGNAVNNMFNVGIEGVNYIVCNTDVQALKNSPVPIKIQIGKKLTEGLGAGNNPERGRESAIESIEEIKEVLQGAKMVFITAGMGGGTGTGAAPVIAKAAKDMDILTIGIVTIPYRDEGKPRLRQAIKGLEELSQCVDSLLIVNSQRLVDLYGKLPLSQALNSGNNVLTIAAKGLAEIITVHAIINVDYADLRTAMKDSGCSIIGVGEASGEDRAIEAVKNALHSPLLNNNDISGSKYIIVNMFSSPEHEMLQEEMGNILQYLRDVSGCEGAGIEESLIWGAGYDETLGDKIRVTVVATGFAQDAIVGDPVQPKVKPVIVVNSDGGIEETTSEEDDSNAKTIDLSEPEVNPYDEKIQRIYESTPDESKEEAFTLTTRDLRDPEILPFESLKNDDIIAKIEKEPAFVRRMPKKQ